MTPKSQLCACSFLDSLRQKNWALGQIRKFPDTIGYMWTAENNLNMLCVEAKIFISEKIFAKKKNFWIREDMALVFAHILVIPIFLFYTTLCLKCNVIINLIYINQNLE